MLANIMVSAMQLLLNASKNNFLAFSSFQSCCHSLAYDHITATSAWGVAPDVTPPGSFLVRILMITLALPG